MYPHAIEVPTVTLRKQACFVLRALVAVAQRYEIDLLTEYERQMAYNRTRPCQHGGRPLAAAPGQS